MKRSLHQLKTFKVLLSRTSISQLNSLNEKIIKRIKESLQYLKEDPYMSRSGADIKKLKTFDDPKLYRLRVGDYRIIYFVLKDEVKVI